MSIDELDPDQWETHVPLRLTPTHRGMQDVMTKGAVYPWGDAHRPRGPFLRDPEMPYYKFLKELQHGQEEA